MSRPAVLLRIFLLALMLGLIINGLQMLSQPLPAPIAGVLLVSGLLGFGALSMWFARSDLGAGLQLMALFEQAGKKLPYHLARYIMLQIGIGLLALSFLVYAQPVFLPWGLLTIWGSSLILLQLGTFVLPSTVSYESVDKVLWADWEIPALTALTVIALCTRALMVGTIPFPMHGDEGEMGSVARQILQGTVKQPFATEWIGHPSLWFFLQTGSLQLFGNDIGGLRLLSALVGTLAIPICYVFARAQYGRAVAWSAGILLAVMPVHVHFSRIALNNIVDPTLATASLGLLFYGWRTGKLAAFMGSGLLLGLGQHSYFGARLAIVLVFLLILYQCIRNRALLYAHRWGMLLMLIGFIAGFGPLLSYYLEQPERYTARMNSVGVMQPGYITNRLQHGETLLGIVSSQLWRGFGAYTTVPDVGLFYAAQQPILSLVASVLFICGIAVVCLRIRKPHYFLLIAWVSCTALLGGSLLIDSPQPSRYVIATPAICLVIAIGLVYIVNMLWALLGLNHGRRIVICIALACLALQSLLFYFVDYSRKMDYARGPALTMLAKEMQLRPAYQQIFLLGAPFVFSNHGTIHFLAPDRTMTDILEPITPEAPIPRPDTGFTAVYYAVPARIAELRIIQSRYPGGRFYQVSNMRDPSQLIYAVYETP